MMSMLIKTQTIRLMVFLALGVLASCRNYQAPISEQGRTQVVQSPEIISSNAGNEQSRVQPQNSTPSYSSSAPETRVQVSSSSGRSAARVSTPTTSPASQGGISRRAIGESISPGFSRSAPSISRSPVSSAASSAVSGAGSAVSALNPLSHLVSAGDTLFSIAYQYNLDFRTLAMANGLNPPYTIFVGQEINLASQLAGTVTNGLVDAAGNVIGNNAPTRATISTPSINNTSPSSGTSLPVRWRWPHQGSILRGFAASNNSGIDISGNVGDPVLAAGSGDVVYSGRGVQGSGNLIIIRHSDSYLSAYAHNSAMLVPEGQRVEAGQQIAEVGVNDQGVAMLHFEIRRDGASVDPMEFLPRP